jgi:hypothetical protein
MVAASVRIHATPSTRIEIDGCHRTDPDPDAVADQFQLDHLSLTE